LGVWNLPKDLLAYHSTFFAGALNGSFLEADLKTIELQDEDPSVFEFFIQWLYTGKAYFTDLCLSPEARDNADGRYTSILVRAWVLADKLGCLAFRDFVMICLVNLHYQTMNLRTSVIRIAYNNTTVNSKLREWIVDQFWSDASDGAYTNLDEEGSRLEELKDLEDWGLDVSERLMLTSGGKRVHPNPYDRGQFYLDVLGFEEL